jgi:hypothetical protein
VGHRSGRDQVLKGPLKVVKGCIDLPEKPGLGTELVSESPRENPHINPGTIKAVSHPAAASPTSEA